MWGLQYRMYILFLVFILCFLLKKGVFLAKIFGTYYNILYLCIRKIKLNHLKLKIMNKYNYFDAICDDVREYITENGITVNSENRQEVEEQLNDDLFINDSVTGNASGSYTFNTWQAEENICHNLDLLQEACDEFGGCYAETLEKGAEACDVTIRCYLLGSCISQVLDEICEDAE